jgi:large subunit ribosomal protein L1
MARSKRYAEMASKIDATKMYPVSEAVALLKETSTTKFTGSVELHVRLGIDVAKGDQQVRSTVTLPHGTGKTVKIAVFAPEDKAKEAKAAGADMVGGEEAIADIKKSGKIDFDVAIATPDMMRHMAQIAKLLGPRGLMPSPKNDTVTNDVVKAIEELKKGKVSFKNDSTANVHMIVGKTDFEASQLAENIETALDAIRKAKPASSKGTFLKNVSLNATMGPGIKLLLA